MNKSTAKKRVRVRDCIGPLLRHPPTRKKSERGEKVNNYNNCSMLLRCCLSVHSAQCWCKRCNRCNRGPSYLSVHNEPSNAVSRALFTLESTKQSAEVQKRGGFFSNFFEFDQDFLFFVFAFFGVRGAGARQLSNVLILCWSRELTCLSSGTFQPAAPPT